jgi:uncharacterized membrane protein
MVEEFGPVQIMVVGFPGTEFRGEILPELQRLRDADLVRVIDLVVVAKDDNDEIIAVELSDLSPEQTEELGAIAGALIGLGAEGDEGLEPGAEAGAMAAEDGFLGDETMWSIADTIPAGTTAAVALLEHRWAIPLRDAIRRAGGIPLADSWIHPEDLVAIGAAVADANAAEGDG